MKDNETSTITHGRHGDLITTSFGNKYSYKCSSTALLCYRNLVDIMEVLRGVAGSIGKTDSQRDIYDQLVIKRYSPVSSSNRVMNHQANSGWTARRRVPVSRLAIPPFDPNIAFL